MQKRQLDRHSGWARFYSYLLSEKHHRRHCRNDAFERIESTSRENQRIAPISTSLVPSFILPSPSQQKRQRRPGHEVHTCDPTVSQPKMTQTYRRRHSRGTQPKQILTTDIVVSRLVSSSHVGQRTARTMITRGVAGSSWANCLCLLPYVCSGKKTD